ncbi:MAG: SdiA-regulated domain-containing protein [Rhodocyclaceae bacterium]|nr:SdiA-regulated domain-containing protein [Rhodocyclaceae bacterium]
MHDVPLASTAPPLGGRRTLSPTAWRPLALGVPAPGLISLLVVLLLAAWVGYAATERRLGILEPDRIVAIDDFPELSGIAYLPGSGTLLGVGDNGEIAEISLEGKVLRKRLHANRDFEDIVLLAHPDLALATDEQHALLVTISLTDLSIIEEHGIPAGFSLTRHKNKSVEGLALAGEPPRLVLANEYPPAITFFSGTSVPPRTVLLGAASVSGVIAGPSGELLVISRENGLMLLDAEGQPQSGWRPVEYHHIEGAAFVPGIGLVLCVDRNPGILLIFSAIKDWDALRHALVS